MRWEARTMRFGKSFFNGAVARSDVRRYWPALLIYFLPWVVALPLSLSQEQGYAEDSGVTVLYTLPFSVVMTCIIGCVLGAALMSYLTSPRAVQTLHALPLKRTAVLLTHFVTGFAMFTATNLLLVLLSVFATVQKVPWAALGIWLGLTELMGFFFLSLGFLASTLTGWLLAIPAVYALVQSAAAAVYALLHGIGSAFYYGYAPIYDLPDALLWLTPAVHLCDLCEDAVVWDYSGVTAVALSDRVAPETLAAVWVYAAVGVVLLALSCVLYALRRSESAGDAVAHRPLRPVVKYVGALGVGLAAGLLLHGIFDLDIIVAAAVCAVIACFVIEMLLKKTAKVFRTGWKSAAAVCVAVIAVCLCIRFDLTGYQTRVPAPDDVADVQINLRGRAGVYGNTYTDRETIDAALALHRQIVADWRENGERPAGENDVYFFFYVTYRLQNGATVSREYHSAISKGSEAESLANALCNTRAMQWHRVFGDLPMDKTPQLTGGYLSGWNRTTGDLHEVSLSAEQAQQFYAALLEDLNNGCFAGSVLEDEGPLTFDLELFSKDENFSGYIGYLTPSCAATVALLKTYGLTERDLFSE